MCSFKLKISLYLKIRDIAINNYGYKNDGISYFKIDDLIRTVSSEYKYSLKVGNIWFWSFQSQVKNEINKGFLSCGRWQIVQHMVLILQLLRDTSNIEK